MPVRNSAGSQKKDPRLLFRLKTRRKRSNWTLKTKDTLSVSKYLIPPYPPVTRLCAGSYPRLIRFYTFVPLTSLLTWLLGVFFPLAFTPRQPHHPHPQFFPSPLPEFVTSAALWSLSHQFRLPLFSLISWVVDNSNVAVVLHASLHVIVYDLLRLTILPILGIRNDVEHDFPTRSDYAFLRVWWVSLGWSFVEVIVAVWQGYEQLALYKDVMIPDSRVKDLLRSMIPPEERDYEEIPVVDLAACKHKLIPPLPHAHERLSATDLLLPVQRSANEDDELEQNLDKLARIKSREELEQVYGGPVIVSHLPIIGCFRALTVHRRTFQSSSLVCRRLTR